MKNVWPETFVDENNLTQSISVLRKALCELPGTHSYIATLPGRGYHFVAAVETVGSSDLRVEGRDHPEQQGLSGTVVLQQRTIRTSIVTEETRQRPLRSSRHILAGASALHVTIAALSAAGYAYGGDIIQCLRRRRL